MLSFVPVGLLSLKAYADQLELGADIRVTEVNGLINAGRIPNDDEFYEHLVDAILDRDDDFVGLMTDADSLHHTVITAQRVKSRRPDVKVCLGGPASSPMSSLLLETFPFIDYVVRGEGEHTFGELIQHLRGKRRAGRDSGADLARRRAGDRERGALHGRGSRPAAHSGLRRLRHDVRRPALSRRREGVPVQVRLLRHGAVLEAPVPHEVDRAHRRGGGADPRRLQAPAGQLLP